MALALRQDRCQFAAETQSLSRTQRQATMLWPLAPGGLGPGQGKNSGLGGAHLALEPPSQFAYNTQPVECIDALAARSPGGLFCLKLESLGNSNVLAGNEEKQTMSGAPWPG